QELDCTPPRKDVPAEQREQLLREGKVSHEQLAAAYREADVFFQWGREGYCYPILEAMSSGCLVVTNCAHLAYLVPGENCLTFANIPELLKLLERVQKEPFTELKRAGQATAADLTWE